MWNRKREKEGQPWITRFLDILVWAVACEEAGATGEPSVGPSEGPRERPFGALCTTEAHRLQQTSHGPTGSSPSGICLLLPPRPSPPSHLLLLLLLRRRRRRLLVYLCVCSCSLSFFVFFRLVSRFIELTSLVLTSNDDDSTLSLAVNRERSTGRCESAAEQFNSCRRRYT